jgi:hypothetical protein
MRGTCSHKNPYADSDFEAKTHDVARVARTGTCVTRDCRGAGARRKRDLSPGQYLCERRRPRPAVAATEAGFRPPTSDL